MVNERLDRPLVSVIMPAYNAERFIEAAIRSVQNQTVTDWELLVIDDGSVDATCAIVERMAAEDRRVILLRNEANVGVARTRNRGFDLCSGSYVALLDSDDIWHREKLEKQLARHAETGADLTFTSYAIIDAAGSRIRADYLVPPTATLDRLLKENVIGCSTVMLKASVVKKHHFRTDFYHEDYVLWVQLLRSGFKAAGCTEVLVDWRYIRDSRSFNKQKAAGNRWRIYREYLKLPFLKCVWLFANYAAVSLKKYGKPQG